MGINLKEFYQDIESEVIADEPSSSAPADTNPGTNPGANSAGSGQPRGGGPGVSLGLAAASKQGNVTLAVKNDPVKPDPASLTIDAGKQYEELSGKHKALMSLLDQAKAGNPEALSQVVQRYGFDTDSLEITITEPLRDNQGNEPQEFGIKLIHNQEEWDAIARDWETASAYFPDSELHNFPTTRRGKRLAVVMGVSARDFNAVIAAERARARLEGEMQAIYSDMEKGRKEMGVDKVPRMPAGADKKPSMETPPTAKSMLKTLSPKR